MLTALSTASFSRSRPEFARALRTGERWYAVYAAPRRETTAQQEFCNQGFRSFLPRYHKTTRHARKVTRTLAPLFPRYLFVALDLQRDRWQSVNGTFGVIGLVSSGDRPTPVQANVVEALIAASSPNGTLRDGPDLEPGQCVRLAAGPFASQLGVLTTIDDAGRVRVLMDMMGGRVLVCIPRRDVVGVP